ncbi:MAG: hypothetical protein HGB32_05180 [Geobacteraceae bacterium]|nr:hypothetical protein [Geobacteraceae bacterium]NTW79523.1 hypothetical protein [Geobacteraceae bacterium]
MEAARLILLNKSFLSSLRPTATIPIIFVVLVFIINNAWFSNLLFGSGRYYSVALFCSLSLIFILNSKLLFTLRSVITVGFLFLFYMVVGIVNIPSDITGFIVVVTFWMNCLIVYNAIKTVEYDNAIKLCQFLIVGQFVFLSTVDITNWIIRGRGLPILIETMVAVPFFGILLLGVLRRKEQNTGRFYWIIAVCSLYLIISIITDYSLNEKKIQKIQLGLMAFTIIFFFLLYAFRSFINKGKLFLVLTPLKCLLLFLFGLAINFALVTQTLILFQPSSGFLRFAINVSMLKELFGVSLLFGRGLGSSWKLFDVTDLHPEAFKFEFDAMYPHSGLVVLLYEYGAIGLLILGYFVLKYMRFPNKNIKRFSRDYYENRFQSSWLLLGLVLFFLFQNGMYVQGMPSGDLYFQSNFVFYIIFTWLIIRSQSLNSLDKPKTLIISGSNSISVLSSIKFESHL